MIRSRTIRERDIILLLNSFVNERANYILHQNANCSNEFRLRLAVQVFAEQLETISSFVC